MLFLEFCKYYYFVEVFRSFRGVGVCILVYVGGNSLEWLSNLSEGYNVRLDFNLGFCRL